MANVTKTIFCAACQLDTAHSVARVDNRDGLSEVVATCQTENCGRMHKYPVPESPEQFNELIAAHKASNLGQITVEIAEAEAASKDAAFLAAMGVAE